MPPTAGNGEFTADQIALLSALADHASVILQIARALDRAEESAAETGRALDELREHGSARDKSNIVHQDLIHAVLRGGGYAQVARTPSSALERGTVVVDSELRPLMKSSGEQMEKAFPWWSGVLKSAGRQRNLDTRAREIQAGMRVEHLAAPAPVAAAFAATTKSRRNYAGTSPLTIASGKKRAVPARHVRNRRLYDAIDQWAFCALSSSPGARDLYDQRRDAGDLHHQALRALGNRLVGIRDVRAAGFAVIGLDLNLVDTAEIADRIGRSKTANRMFDRLFELDCAPTLQRLVFYTMSN